MGVVSNSTNSNLNNSNSNDNNSKKKESQEISYDFELKSEKSLQINFDKSLSINCQSETTENTIILDTDEETFPYKFEWKEGGNEVKIAGTFLNNWKDQILMKKNPNTGFYEITLNIQRGIHQFKFIVDNKWVCSPKYETCNEKNNINNIMDFTNYNPNNNNNSNINSNDKIKKKKKKKLIKDRSVEYNSIFPKQNDINKDPPSVPLHYLNSFDLNNQSKQELLKDYFQKYYKYNISKNQIENNTFKTIMTICHDKLSHICYGEENNNTNLNNLYIRTSITQRNKHKLLTVIYYNRKK